MPRPGTLALALAALLLPAAGHCQSPPDLSAAMKAMQQDQSSRHLYDWMEQVHARITAYWLMPQNAPPRFTCDVHVVQDAEGNVQSANITHSCGSPALDDSLLQAIHKADPLPAEPDRAHFQPDLILRFCPTAGCS